MATPLIMDEFRDVIFSRDFKVNFKTEAEANMLFDIYRQAYGINPGPVMAESYMKYPYMYISPTSGRSMTCYGTIEGTSAQPSNYVTFGDFLNRFCICVQEDDKRLQLTNIDSLL